MPNVYDMREHGCLFAAVDDFDKAQEFVYLASDLFDGTLDFTILQGIPFEEPPTPTMELTENPDWSIWVFPKGRPKYSTPYFDLGSKISFLARLMEWPLAKYPPEAIPC